jgi:putative transposase
MFEAHRFLYNTALQERREAWKRHRLSIGFSAQCKSLTQIRAEDPDYRALSAQSAQVTLKRLHRSFGAFFRRVKDGETPGFPRFKSKARFSGWGYKTHGDGFRLDPQ